MKNINTIEELVLYIQEFCASLSISNDYLTEDTISEWFKKYDEINKKCYSEYQDWLNGISDKNTQSDFNKGMLEADKELQKICENAINEESLRKIGFYKGLGLDYDIDETGNAIVFKNGLFYFMGSETESIQYSFKLKINSIEKLLNIISVLKHGISSENIPACSQCEKCGYRP